MKQKTVLIMTVPFGGGHYATAAKIADLLKQRDSSVDVQILDVITDGWPWYARQTTQAYQDSTASNSAFWFRVYYKLTDTFPAPLRWFASVAFSGYAKRKFRELQPDLLISTFPFLGHVAARARKALGMKVPIVTIVTDAGRVQAIWLCGNEDAILTATPDTVAYAEARRLAEGRVRFIGFPVNAAFYDLQSSHSARNALGLDPHQFTILLTSGGFGMGAQRVIRLVERLAGLQASFQLICIAGKNETLQADFKAIQFPSHIKPLVLGYVDNMPELMAASDIIVSKSGWLTISEAVAARRPLFLFDAIPGHEEQNAQYVTRGGFGVFEPDADKMVIRIEEAITEPHSLAAYHEALARHDTREVPQQLAAYLLGLLD
mgnify:FL=1